MQFVNCEMKLFALVVCANCSCVIKKSRIYCEKIRSKREKQNQDDMDIRH